GDTPAAEAESVAEADMNHSSSILFVRSTSSRTVIFPSSSNMVSTELATMLLPPDSAARSQPRLSPPALRRPIRHQVLLRSPVRRRRALPPFPPRPSALLGLLPSRALPSPHRPAPRPAPR